MPRTAGMRTAHLGVGPKTSAWEGVAVRGGPQTKPSALSLSPETREKSPKHNDQIHSQRLLPPTVPTVPTAHRAESGFDGVEAADSGARALRGKPVVL